MNNSGRIGDFVRENITNQGISSGSKFGLIFTIICGIILIGGIIYLIVFSPLKLKKDENETTGGKSAEDRINLGLEVYKNYFNMNQLPLPENGIYFNVYYNQKKYYGLRDFFYASSYKSYLPCGYTDDVVSYNATSVFFSMIFFSRYGISCSFLKSE